MPVTIARSGRCPCPPPGAGHPRSACRHGSQATPPTPPRPPAPGALARHCAEEASSTPTIRRLTPSRRHQIPDSSRPHAPKKVFRKNTIDLQWKIAANYNARPCDIERKAGDARTMGNNEKNNGKNNGNSRSFRAHACIPSSGGELMGWSWISEACRNAKRPAA